MIRVNLHLHTKFSGDATTNPKFVVDSLYAHPLIKEVAVTNHDSLKGSNAHNHHELWRAYTKVDAEPDIGSV
jgi:predicted metal-dependent phosphoesterase TrpH